MIDLSASFLPDAFAWATATEPAVPTETFYCETRDTFAAHIERLRRKQQQEFPVGVADLLNAVTAEIGGNSFDHNLGQWRDIPGVYLADILSDDSGLVVMADRGQGIRA